MLSLLYTSCWYASAFSTIAKVGRRAAPSSSVCSLSSVAPGRQAVLGGHVPYAELAQTLHQVENEPLRLGKEALMARLLEKVWRESPEDLTLCVSLASLQLRPAERPLKLGMGNSLVLQAVSAACGASPEELKDELTRCGDLGDVAAARLDATAPTAEVLTLHDVCASLLELEAQQGKGAAGRKTEQLAAMLQRASPLEARYLLRSIRGKDRTGLGARSLRAALAQVGVRVCVCVRVRVCVCVCVCVRACACVTLRASA